MPDTTPTVETLSEADFDRFYGLFAAAFMEDRREEFREQVRSVFAPDRTHGVFDGDELIGAGTMLHPEITLPGRRRCPLAAVSTVGVLPGHRRRGVLRTLMRAQLHGLYEAGGAPLAALFASEGAIYGRYGYGPGTDEMRLALPRGARFAETVEVDPRPVRETDRERALEFAAELYPAVAAGHTGWLSRDDAAWRVRVADPNPPGGGTGTLRHAVHPDGYALYRPKPAWTERGPAYELRVQEIVARNQPAYAALWRYLLDIDLVGEVQWDKAAVDEPVVDMLVDPRQARRRIRDGLWLRLVDLDRVLPARHYSAPLDVVLQVADSFCPWNAGRHRLRVDSAGLAQVEPTRQPAELAMDITALGSIYLGGTNPTRLSRAGRITELRAGALTEASRAFATDHAPQCPEGF